METVIGIIKESYYLLGKMAPYLLFGFFFAGVLHVFLKKEMISKHLGENTFSSVIKAALFGIPLPLCSCSVIPAAMSLRKEGASRGAVLSFLIATPTTGVDSIFATYSLLGIFFTVYRIVASFLTGTIAGILANIFVKEERKDQEASSECSLCGAERGHSHSIKEKLKNLFSYAFGVLIKDSGVALVTGLVIGGVIAYFMPESFIEEYMGHGFKAMIIMLLIGIPMYVCATASIPIAAALMLKGLDPGAAFVFLVAGPATNIVTMTVVAKNMGIRTLTIYLSSIIFSSLFLGMIFDFVYSVFYSTDASAISMHHKEVFPPEVQVVSSIILIALIAVSLLRRKT